MSSDENLKVTIQIERVNGGVMIQAGGKLTMDINNKRGNVTVNRFIQLEPIPDPNDELTNVFPLLIGTTDQYLNETLEVELNAGSINNYPQGTLFRVKAEVEND